MGANYTMRDGGSALTCCSQLLLLHVCWHTSYLYRRLHFSYFCIFKVVDSCWYFTSTGPVVLTYIILLQTASDRARILKKMVIFHLPNAPLLGMRYIGLVSTAELHFYSSFQGYLPYLNIWIRPSLPSCHIFRACVSLFRTWLAGLSEPTWSTFWGTYIS